MTGLGWAGLERKEGGKGWDGHGRAKEEKLRFSCFRRSLERPGIPICLRAPVYQGRSSSMQFH